jgi:uncharacterized membrane protein
MSTIEESIDVRAPVSAASAQLAEFESFQEGTEVTFVELDENRTRVIVQMAYEPHSLSEPAAVIARVDDRRITDQLESFKDFIEQRAA